MKFMKYLDALNNDAPKPKQGYKRCPACKRECPLSDFTRRATILQSRAWTKNPTSQKRLTYEGKHCNDCHNARRRKSVDISPEVYRKRLVTQGLNPLKIEERVNARRIRGAVNRTEKTLRTRLKNAAPELVPLLESMRDVEKRISNKLIHFRRTNKQDQAGTLFCARYMVMLDSVKQLLKLKAKTGAKLPAAWHELIAERFHSELWDLFKAVPAEHTQRLAPFLYHIPRP
jgi:hypothetical protein